MKATPPLCLEDVRICPVLQPCIVILLALSLVVVVPGAFLVAVLPS